MEGNQYPELATMYYLNCPISNKTLRLCKEIRKYDPYTGK